MITATNSKPITVEEYPAFEGKDAGYAVLLVRGGLGVWGVIKFERAWVELKAQDGWEMETFAKLDEFTASQVGPDAEVVILDLWEPVAASIKI